MAASLYPIASRGHRARPMQPRTNLPRAYSDRPGRGELTHPDQTQNQLRKRTARSIVVARFPGSGRLARLSDAILVTGGAGYVGSHACKALAGAGYRPVVYDNLSRGHREAVRWGPLIEGDLNDTDQVAAALQTHRVTAVMHFAAYAYVGE